MSYNGFFSSVQQTQFPIGIYHGTTFQKLEIAFSNLDTVSSSKASRNLILHSVIYGMSYILDILDEILLKILSYFDTFHVLQTTLSTNNALIKLLN